MFISLASVPDPDGIWARWGSTAEGFEGVLFLHFGQELVVSLTREELLTLDHVVAEAFDDAPRSVAEVAQKTQ